MIRVVLVDDEEHALDMLEILLKQIGEVEVVGRFSNSVLALLDIERTRPDAVFIDIQMHGVSGLEVAKQICDISPKTHIIFTTAYAEYAVDAFTLGSLDYLLKPISLDRLQKSIERIASQSSATAIEKVAHGKPIQTNIECLSSFSIRYGEKNERLAWRTAKEKELCAFLIHHAGEPVDQAVIIDALWDEADVDKARAYLYKCVSLLRKQFRNSNLTLDVEKVETGYVIRFRGTHCDWIELQSSLAKCTKSLEAGDTSLVEPAIVLYKGDYLEGCDYPWARQRQIDLLRNYVELLRKAAGLCKQRGDVDTAIRYLDCLLKHCPESEKDGRELMRLYLLQGNRHEAIRAFQRLQHAVRAILDMDVERETHELYEHMLASTSQQP